MRIRLSLAIAMNIVAGSLSAALAQDAANKLNTPYGLDLFGIRLGMSIADAEAAATRHLGTVGRVANWDNAPQGWRGRLLLADSGTEAIAFFESSRAPGRVFFATRSLLVEHGMIEPLIQAMNVAFGEPISFNPLPRGASTGNASGTWGTGSRGCSPSVELDTRRTQWMDGDVQIGPTMQAVGPHRTMYLVAARVAAPVPVPPRPDCGPMLSASARLNPPTTQFSNVVVAIYDLSLDVRPN
jgi:hypothetical protein